MPRALALATLLAAACTVGNAPPPQQPAVEPAPSASAPSGLPPATAAPGPALADRMDEGEPVACQGNDQVVLENTRIRAAGVAVLAQGNCTVVIRNCDLQAEDVAVVAQGNAAVTIDTSRVAGSTMSIEIQGNGSVTATGSHFTGGAKTQGNGRLLDDGSNNWD